MIRLYGRSSEHGLVLGGRLTLASIDRLSVILVYHLLDVNILFVGGSVQMVASDVLGMRVDH